MIHRETHMVTATHGPRPAGKPDECFYCKSKIGQPHAADCVLRSRTVVVCATIEYVINVPEHWTKNDIEFHRNESSWCASNMVAELERLTTDTDEHSGCICGRVGFKYFGEATAEEDARDGMSVLPPPPLPRDPAPRNP